MNELPDLPETLLCRIDRQGVLGGLNRACGSLLGVPPETLLNRPLSDLLHEEDREPAAAALAELWQIGSARFTARTRGEGDYRPLSWEVAVAADGNVAIAAARRVEDTGGPDTVPEQYRDPLTGLPNRELLLDRLGHTLQRARRRNDFSFALLQVGVDRFKVINDSLGHRVGDMLLAGIARTLEHCIRPTDTVARLGGDEFAILLEDIQDASSTLRVVKRIQEQLNLPFWLRDHEVFTNVSIGIVVNADSHFQGDDFIRDANIAMHRAKHQGGAGYVVFDKGMHDQAVRRMRLEMDLRRAIEHGEFQAYYQPIMDLQGPRLEGFEALVRWVHPEQGLVSPVDFIPVAEETGMIVPIGRWVLREACRQTQAWQDEFRCDPPLSISVNLSPRQLVDGGLVDDVRAILEETGLPPTQLKLEITESAVLENTTQALELLHRLKAMSIRLCLDDFGTGYSSLSYLHQLPIDILKIDRSFVSTLNQEKMKGNFVATIVSLSHSLDLKVVSEGVETRDQERLIREIGSEFGQGYLYSRPVAGEEARIFIATQPAAGET